MEQTSQEQQPEMAEQRMGQLMMCLACEDVLTDKDVGYRCSCCAIGVYCKPCLQHWFVVATNALTEMPPSCCSRDLTLEPGVLNVLGSIEVNIGSHHLLPPWSFVTLLTCMAQKEEYLARREEWLSKRLLYCPIPTCSAFIPSRLYVKPHPGMKSTVKLVDGMAIAIEDPLNLPLVQTEPVTSCPKCLHHFCTHCRRDPHVGEGLSVCELPDIDEDDVLKQKLEKWGARRW